jgi:glycosyltransferase involved in cell wall biosynthesis
MHSFDIAIPNYNYGRYLRDCVESVLSQRDVNVRLLIVDNGSTDDSATIARQLAKEDHRIELRLREKNLGPHASFNEGIEWADAEFFLILCSDDLLAPNVLTEAANFLDQNRNVNLVYGRMSKILADTQRADIVANHHDANWRIRSGIDYIGACCRNAISLIDGPLAISRTDVQKKVGYYRSQLAHTDDMEMWLRFATYGDIGQSDAIQAYIRWHPQSRSADISGILQWNREVENAFISFFEHEGRNLHNRRQHLEEVRNCLSKRAYWSAVSNAMRREKGAGALLFDALKRKPLMAILPPFDYLLNRAARRKYL